MRILDLKKILEAAYLPGEHILRLSGVEVMRLARKLELSPTYLEDRHIPTIMEWCNDHPMIDTLLLSGNSIEDVGGVLLAQLPSLKALELGMNDIGDHGVERFATNNTLVRLALQSNIVTDVGAVTLSENTTLKELNLYGNPIGNRGAVALAGMHWLEFLDVELCSNIGEEGRKALHESRIRRVLS